MRFFRDATSAYTSPTGSNTSAATLRFRPVQRDEVHAALRLILSTSGASASEEQVVDFLRFALYRGINLNDIWIADSADKMQWAILPVLSPGRTMLLFAPSFAPPRLQGGCICPLIERVLQHYSSRAIDLAQVLIDPTETAAVQMYQACGFDHLAELIYLDREVRRCPDPAMPPGYAWQTYSSATHRDFALAVSASYEASLDCPHLNGRRNIEDVLAGHKAAGEFDPSLWLLLRYGATPAGVMLLNRSTRSDAIELVYLGLIPRQRGRHLGDLLMQRALSAASSVGARRLSLAVDSSNVPALRLYKRHGMAQVCSRIALMRDLREGQRSSPQLEKPSLRDGA